MATLKQLSTELYGEASAQAMQTILDKSAFLRMLETTGGWELEASDFDWRPAVANVALSTIAESGSWASPTDLAIDSKQTGALKFYYSGFTLSASRILDAKKGLVDTDIWVDKKRAKVHRAFALNLEKEMFMGSGLSNAMSGFKTILDGSTALPGYTDTTLVPEALDRLRVMDANDYSKVANSKSFDINNAANADALMALIREATYEVDDAKAIVMSKKLRPSFVSIAHAKNQYTVENAYEHPVEKFGGIPVIYVENAAIASNEPDNTSTIPSTNTTSIYVMSPEEQRLSVVSNSGLWYYTYDHEENAYKNTERLGVNMALKIEDNKSILRVRNIKC